MGDVETVELKIRKQSAAVALTAGERERPRKTDAC